MPVPLYLSFFRLFALQPLTEQRPPDVFAPLPTTDQMAFADVQSFRHFSPLLRGRTPGWSVAYE